MFTISDIIADIDRGCMAHNMMEECFSYRIVYFINENGKGTKYYTDTLYGGLRKALENIIRGNLSTENIVVIAAVTVRKNGESVSLLSKSYLFSLSEYFQKLCGKKRERIYKQQLWKEAGTMGLERDPIMLMIGRNYKLSILSLVRFC